MERSELNELHRAIEEGADADHFKQTSLGRFIVRHAADEIIDCTEKLRSLDFTDPDSLQKAHAIQTDLRVAERLIVYIETAIREGIDAINTLQAAEDSHSTDSIG